MFDDYQTKSMIKLVRLFTLFTALANAQHEYRSKYEVKSERRNLQDGSVKSGGWQQRHMRSRERNPDPTKPNNEGIEIDMNLIAIPPGLVTLDGGRDGYEGGEYSRLSSNKAPGVTSRIINGDRAPQHRYPWMVSIFDHKEDGSLIYKCGGSLVAPNIVMSAAHCHKIAKVVQIGRRDLYDPTEEYEEYKITQIITHPQYDEKLFLSDVMLLVFDGISKHEPILLNHPGSSFVVEKGQSLTVTGWGSTQTSYHGGSRRNLVDAGSTTLLEVVIEAWSFEECLKTYNTPNKLGTYTICANKDSDPLKDNSFNDACQGDSGGPLIIRRSARSVSDDNDLQQSQLRDLQVGIVSWGAGCGDPKFPGVYARVSHLYLWINEKICEHSPAQCDKTAAIVVNTDNKPDQDEEDNVITECLDEEMFVYYNPKKDKRKTFTCEYVREDKGRRCKDYGEFCPVSCGLCGKM